MQTQNNTSKPPVLKYPVFMRFLHWSMALIILGLTAMGYYMSSLPFEAENKLDLYPLHRALGVLLFILLFVRLFVRQRNTLPKTPEGLPKHEKILSKIVHILLYVGMASIPVLGYVASSAVPEFPGVPPLNSIWFFGIELPLAPVEKNYDFTKLMIGIHAYLAYFILGVVALHIAGALKHRFFDKPENDVLSKMI